MAATRLTQRRVDTLQPRKTVRNVRDAELKGSGVRITPSGRKRYFIHSQHRGHWVRKIVGDAAVMTEAEARARARSMLAALRDGRDIEVEASRDALFETVAEEVFVRYDRRWKPRTLAVNRYYLKRQILPFFAGWPIAELTREEVQRWFRSLHATPAAAVPTKPRAVVSSATLRLTPVQPADKVRVSVHSPGTHLSGSDPALIRSAP